MTLYTGMAGSPITYLTEAMTAGQTTATVSDGTALPDAPNLCTIGFGENIETIRYGAKVGNSLSDITRGIEGVPQAWDVGTEVARFFTAYDHNAIINTLMSHLAENEQQFSEINNVLQHYGAPIQAPYNNGDERWHDVSGIRIYYVSTSHEGYPSSLGILIHINHPSTSATWQLFFGPPGNNWTRRVTGNGSFADSQWVAM